MTDTTTAGDTKVLPDQLMNSVLGGLYTTLTSGDGDLLADRDSFFTWATPGLPVTDDQFDFMGGFLPQGETTAEREAEAARRYALAADFSALVDFLPSVDGVFDSEQQTTVLGSRRGRLSGEYERALTQSEVAKQELTDEQRANLERLQGLLVSQREEVDLVTGETKTVPDDSALVKRYDELYSEYEAAALAFSTARIQALSGAVDGAAAGFAINGPILSRKVRAALDAWESTGRRNELDEVRAHISQVTGRSMVLYKQDLVEQFERAKLSDAGGGPEFLYTALTPANVLRSGGWTRFTFNSSMVERFRGEKTNKWKAGGAAFLGLTIGGTGGGSRREVNTAIDATNFHLSFDLVQVPIRRPWFRPEFLESRGWRFPPGQQPLSDGEEPPQEGTLFAYPETAILARNVRLEFDELHEEGSEVAKEFRGKGGLSWGMLHLGGDYERSAGEERHERVTEGQGIRVPGTQIIGYRCYLLPKAPNPADDVETWV